jgi:molybdenum cofactor biosynthesis enzyme MoaA
MAATRELNRHVALETIRARLADADTTLREAILRRHLYFRVSVVGACNLGCSFCHNEGAPKTGKLNVDNAQIAFDSAARVGFERIQLTGGEPLLRPDIARFVYEARRSFSDVGVTTNGVYLPRRIEGMVEAGLTRLHVSLQTESLIDAGSVARWDVPKWLRPAIERANAAGVEVRVNLPVPADLLPQAEAFLAQLQGEGVSAKVFSVLPEGEAGQSTRAYPVQDLEDLVQRARDPHRPPASIVVRGYRPPAGLRCPTCSERARCKEQSHSLRLGADLVLRPCLATRRWDAGLDLGDPDRSIAEAATLAIDYTWPEVRDDGRARIGA